LFTNHNVTQVESEMIQLEAMPFLIFINSSESAIYFVDSHYNIFSTWFALLCADFVNLLPRCNLDFIFLPPCRMEGLGHPFCNQYTLTPKNARGNTLGIWTWISTNKKPVRATTPRGSAPARFCRQNHDTVRRQVGPTTLPLPHAPTPSLETAPLAGLPSLRPPAGGGGRGRPPLARGGAGEEAAASEAGGRGDDHPRGRGAGEGM
jgi:hypothetical protein